MKRRVLVVDDDALTVEVLETVLNLEEFHVSTASNGHDALALVAEEPPDVMVLDVMMPGIDGFAVCNKIKSDPATADISVILLTARDRSEDREAGTAAGADAYLTKPFSPLALIETISSLEP